MLPKLKIFLNYIRKYGFSFSLKALLTYLNIKTFYIEINYPTINRKIKVIISKFWKILENKEWEPVCIELLYDLVHEDETILDIGAWKGPYTILFSTLVKQKGTVIAFDPDPKAFLELKNNILKNNLSNVKLEQTCLGNVNGHTKLVSKSWGISESSIVRKMEHNFKELTVDVTTIDDYCSTNNIRPNGIKIDVEGAEGLVIEGAQEIIQKYSPWVFLEFHPFHIPEDERQKVWDSITKKAKKIIFIDGYPTASIPTGTILHSIPDSRIFHVLLYY